VTDVTVLGVIAVLTFLQALDSASETAALLWAIPYANNADFDGYRVGDRVNREN
jgi:hypothetical protein